MGRRDVEQMRGYEIVSRIHEGPRSVVLRAKDDGGLSVVLKRPRGARPGLQARAALEAEHALLTRLAHPRVVRAEGLVQDGHRPVLVMRDAGRSLAERLAERRLELTEALRIALEVAEALEAMHAGGFVHRDVHPGNILLDAERGAILADLGLAAPIEREPAPARSSQLIGQLRYVAPEQTGRTRGWVDERSDLYALGAVLFEMLTGAAPFTSVDAAELVHAHLAKPAPKLRDLDPRLPEVLEQVVARLLAKRPADRYQSARGLAADLSRLLEQAETDGALGGFPLGAHDDLSAVRLPERLFGRERALAAIDEAISRSGDGGRVLLRITGAPGAGKSALVDVLGRKLAAAGRRMLVGGYSGGRADEPLVGFVEILRQLVQEALTYDEATLAQKRRLLRQVIGDELPLLSRWIPELGALVGLSEPPPVLDPAEMSARLVGAVGRLVAELASREHPAALVLEDLEAADGASLELLERLLTAEDLHYLMIVVTHRPEAAEAGGHLSQVLEAAERARAEQWTAPVAALDAAECEAWLAEALRAAPEDVAPLARVVHAQTAGNPLALTRLLPELAAAGHVRFDLEARKWTFDLDAVRAERLGEDVVGLLLTNMGRLPEPTQAMLQKASCMGRRFDVSLLAEALGTSRQEVLEALAPAAAAGVVRGVDELLGRLVSCGRTSCAAARDMRAVWIEFADERFREAAYRALDEASRVDAHLAFGRWMRDHLPEDEQRGRLFELVAHFEVARGRLDDEAERRAVARLLVDAAERASASAAWARAVSTFAIAFELLGDDPFEADYALAMRVALEARRILLFVRDIPNPPGLPGPEALLERAVEEPHRLDALTLRVVYMCRTGQAAEALAEAATACRRHGLELLPEDPEAALGSTWRRIRAALGDRALSDLAELPRMQDPLHISMLGLVRAAILATYIARRELIGHTSACGVLLSVQHGNGPMSSLAYADFSIAVIQIIGDVEAGLELADAAVQVADALNAYRAGTRVLVAGLAEVYRRPLLDVCRELQDALRFGRETGESLYRGIGASFLASYLYIGGARLDGLSRRIDGLIGEMNRFLGQVGLREVELTQRAIWVLRGEREYPWDLRLEGEDARWALAAEKNPEGLGWGRLLQARLALQRGDAEAACAHAEAAEAWDWRGIAHLNGIEIAFTEIAARLMRGAPGDLDVLRRRVSELRASIGGHWHVNAGHKLAFAEGALAWLGGQRWRALERFEAAVRHAEEKGFVNDQALISELTARCLEQVGLHHAASAFWVEARHAYEEWGATAEVHRLDRWLDSEAQTRAETTHPSSVIAASSDTDAARVDLEAVIRASQALARALGRDDLVQKLLSLVVENAGAERAALVLEQDGGWDLVARLEPEGLVIDERPLERVGPAHGRGAPAEEGVIPVGIVNYVIRVGAPVVLADAVTEGRFGSDPYVSRRRPRALVAAPIERQGRTVGVLYLENNLSPGAFDEGRLEVVEVLASQAAIGMEQARLYDELERKVEARTRDLELKNRDLEASLAREQKMQSRLVMVEKMASLGNLVAGVAHELNTPIGAVLSSADTLRRGLERLERELPEDARAAGTVPRILSVLRDNQAVVADGGARVGEIVRTLRAFAHLDEAERQKADLREGLERTLRLMAHRLGEVRVVRELAPLPPVECFPQELNQVFVNLITNAAQAIADRPGAEQVILRTGSAEAGHVFVEVEDDGPGIPEDVRPHIFDPGYTTRGVGVGLGLGLSICFSIVEKHGGRIEVDGRPGQGARVRVVLPVSAPR